MATSGPVVQIIDPSEYLLALNWSIELNESGEKILRYGQVPNSGYNVALLHTNVTPGDLVAHCYRVGYVQSRVPAAAVQNNTAGGPTGAVAFASQPTPVNSSGPVGKSIPSIFPNILDAHPRLQHPPAHKAAFIIFPIMLVGTLEQRL